MANDAFNFVNSVKGPIIPRSNFNLSHEVKMACEGGYLLPFLCEEILPGDKFKLGIEAHIKLAPMLYPIMHRIDASFHLFFVPTRIIWDDFEKYSIAFANGVDETTPVKPYLSLRTLANMNPSPLANGTLLDYMGFPTIIDPQQMAALQQSNKSINSLPLRAYQCIYNEFYRDENLIEEVDFRKGFSGSDDSVAGNLLTLRKRAWKKDYFTACLPWTQKGDPVAMPLNIQTDGAGIDRFYWANSTNPANISAGSLNSNFGGVMYGVNRETSADGTLKLTSSIASQRDQYGDHKHNITGGSININDLRSYFMLQGIKEQLARGGTRYTEFLRGVYGVVSSDSRLQRPQYLGGCKTPVMISEVLQTSASAETSALGQMAGHGIAVGSSNLTSHYFEEAGFLIGIMSITPKADYYQGLSRMWTRQDVNDEFYPQFGAMGEQAVLNQEVMFTGRNDDHDEQTFGYIPRYSEYRFMPNRVAGEFRDTLDAWHLARKFSLEDPPALNQDFIEVDPSDFSRIFNTAETAPEHFRVQIGLNIRASRPLSKYGTPKVL